MGMAILELGHILFAFLGVLALTILVDGKNQLGFISLDCGTSVNSNYTDEKTTLNYVSDASFVNAGVGKAIAPGFNYSTLARQQWSVRTFPTGDRNCYNIPVTINTKYLIRTTFYYGNYDGLNQLPTFDLHLGVNKWVTVEMVNVTSTLTKEIIYTATMNYIYVCLVNTGKGTPFLNALELRPLPNNTYDVPAGALALNLRLDTGSTSSDSVRYPHDAYDRIWYTYEPVDEWTDISTNLTIDAQVHNDYQPPSLVMKSAIIPTNASEPMKFYIQPPDITLEYYAIFHFAEIEMLGPNQTRIFNISVNEKTWNGPVTPDYLSSTTILNNHPLTGNRWQYLFSLFEVDGSTLPPILNAEEYYYIVNLDLLQTDQDDVDAITNVKSTYGITRNWQGDPCAPQSYSWQGLTCSHPDSARLIITGLNLSSSGLMGSISSDIGNLQSLESLDLSNNSFTGSVPSFLSKLTSLTVLNLSGNNLTGSVPVDLYQRSQNGLLQLSVSGNPNLCLSDSCTPTKTSIVAPVVASIAGVLLLATALATVFICLRRGKKSVVKGNTRKFHEQLEKKGCITYSQLISITNNFERVLGKGGFGTVFHGYLHGNQVAVKMLTSSSAHGYKQFQAEVDILLRVHHGNLLSLVGYCDDSNQIGLIYEYMANGNLRDYMSENSWDPLSWEERLRISIGAAKVSIVGLDYLHNSCEPQIVHRDIKTANILLNEKLQVKLADFGLSRSFPISGGSHVSTEVGGTFGYFDPEYFRTRRFTTKSDVYSFGIVLLEIITGRPAVVETEEMTHISDWVSSMLATGEVADIADPKLGGEFDICSVKKAVEVAMACVSLNSSERPSMLQVANGLTECLPIELATNQGAEVQSDYSSSSISSNDRSRDLSDNSFTGSVPSVLSKLTSSEVLNLSGNNLTGAVPVDLYQRSQSGSLLLSVSGNPNLCLSDLCTPTKVEKKKKKTSIVALAAKKRQFTYSEIRQMTNNFNQVLGKGGFGAVYHGYLGGTPVAVKMLSESSVQGFKEFQAEVKLLLRVHHKNLTTVVGYCDEGPNLGLIYEYMANGNLKDHLSEKNSNTLSLEGRLQVAVEAAQGLEYLHNGCKPRIVHRDVKTANILLNGKFQAKLVDFGLSRAFPTTGYLDPEYYLTNWLTEKSDVYSFGVVLLEIITGRSMIDKAQQHGHMSEWVRSLVENGDINQVVDPRLHGEFDINSVWKVVKLALSCLSMPSARRPTMGQVVIELNDFLATDMARTGEGFSTQSRQFIDTIQVHSTILPVAI